MANLSRRWRIWLSIMLIFLLGSLAGSLATTLHFRWRAPRPHVAQAPERGLHRIFMRLDLTSDQQAEIRVIFDDLRADLRDLHRDVEPRMREIRAKADRRLQQVLSEEQWQQFRRLTPRRHRPPSMPGLRSRSPQRP